jgi:hypothetical protein
VFSRLVCTKRDTAKSEPCNGHARDDYCAIRKIEKWVVRKLNEVDYVASEKTWTAKEPITYIAQRSTENTTEC